MSPIPSGVALSFDIIQRNIRFMSLLLITLPARESHLPPLAPRVGLSTTTGYQVMQDTPWQSILGGQSARPATRSSHGLYVRNRSRYTHS